MAIAPRDANVRALLNERNVRADIPSPHTRYSILSDRSDSPSIYSHFDNNNNFHYNIPDSPVPEIPRFHDSHAFNDNSPLLHHQQLHQLHHHQHYQRNHQLQHTHIPQQPAQSQSRQRLADPNASSLDLNQDSDAYSDSASRISRLDVDDDPEDSNLVPASDEDPDTRLSLMGPRMRVHSRAPWEEEGEEDDLERDIDFDSDGDDGGAETLSVFGGNSGGKKSGGRSAVMRGLGFGGKSVAPRPSFDSIIPNKVKRSFETTSSGHATPKGAIQTLVQASVSSTSLALNASTSNSRLPHKLSMGRLALNRDRSATGPASACTLDRNYASAAFTSPLSATQQVADDDSPVSLGTHMENSIAINRTRSPSPIPDVDGIYTHHPYANPAHVPVINPQSATAAHITRRDQSQDDDAGSMMTRNDTISSFTASEETVMFSHSSSIASASLSSSMDSSTPATSDLSLISASSHPELSRFNDVEKARKDKINRRETKLGPISGPAFIGANNFSPNKPYNLISLGEAQARAKERNRSATTGTPHPIFDAENERTTPRPRASSVATQPLPIITIGIDDAQRDDQLASATNSGSSKQPSPVGPPPGRTVRPKRSGFMKLFNGREKERHQDVPPLPITTQGVVMPQTPETPVYTEQTTPRVAKMSTHRVPVPPLPTSPKHSTVAQSEPRSRKPAPALTIKVSTPPTPFTHGLDPQPRRSDSPKSSSKAHTPLQIPVSAPAGTTQFPSLKLRPVSGFFSSGFADHLLAAGDDQMQSPTSPRADTFSLLSPSTVSSNEPIPSPVNTGGFFTDHPSGVMAASSEDPAAVISALKEQIRTHRKVWQRQIWELEGQVRDLKAEIEDMRGGGGGEMCEMCGRGGLLSGDAPERKGSNGSGVIHRPRAKTGHGARFASGNDP